MINESLKKLEWTKIEPLGIEITELSYLITKQHQDIQKIEYNDCLELAKQIHVNPITHKLLYELIKFYPSVMNEFVNRLENQGRLCWLNNSRTWITDNILFYSRKRRKNGKPILNLVNENLALNLPEKLFGKVCMIQHPNYTLERNGEDLSVIIKDLDSVITREYDHLKMGSSYKAECETRLPLCEKGTDIMLGLERKTLGFLSAFHGPYREDSIYSILIRSGPGGYIVYRTLKS